MRNSKKPLARALTAALLLPVPGMLAQAQAQDGALEEIVVTARRATESLQDVPASVTVLTENTLESSGINSVERIVALTPGVSIVTNTAEVGDTQINIRGINGARDAENNVALVVDGILKTNTAQVAQMQGELIQAEVLKGPQGAYYGRNAAAGAIVLTTAKPGDEFEGDVRVRGGQENLLGGTVEFSGPITDTAGFSVFADYQEFDGFYRNTSPVSNARGATVDATENLTLGGRLVFTPSENSEIDVKARYADFSGSALNFNPVFSLPTFALGNPLFNEDVNDHNYDFIGNIKPENTQETTELSVKGSWDLDTVNVTAWALYSDVDQAWIADGTAATFYRFELTESCRQTATELFDAGYQLPSPQVLLPDPFTSVYGPFGPTTCDGTQYQARSQEDVSAEIRFSSLGDGPLSWSVGAYYLSLERETSVSIAQDTGANPILRPYNPPGSANPTSLMFADAFDTEVFAVFGSVDYDLTDSLALSLALRYDREERDVSSRVPNVNDPITGGPINPGLPADGSPIPDASETFDEWQPKVSLAWTASDDWTLFANWGVGFKAGGFNNQGSGAVLEQNFNIPLGSGLNIGDTYDQETSSAFEAGIKGRQLFGGTTTVELVGYYTDVTDMQFFEFFTGPFGLLRVVSNIDEVEIYGVEGSFYSRLGGGFDIFGSFALNESEIQKNSSRPGTEGNESPYTARYTGNVGALWSGDVGNGLSLTARADWRVTGPTWFHTVQENQVRTTFDLFFPGAGTADYSKTQRDSFSTLDLRVELSSDSGWRVAAFGTNVLDEDIVAEVIPSAEFGGAFLAPGALRLLGVEVGYSF